MPPFALALPFASVASVFSFRVVKNTAKDGDLEQKWGFGIPTTKKQFAASFMKCEKGFFGHAIQKTLFFSAYDYDQVSDAVFKMYDQLPTKCDQKSCPQATWAGCILRTAGHDFMDFADGQGGSDGCLDLDDPDNAGLAQCMFEGQFGFSINDAFQQFCMRMSLADFLVIAAEAVMRKARNLVKQNDSALDFRRNFKYGRRTNYNCSWARGRLPEVPESCHAVETTFVKRLGLNWRETAALSGVHTLGSAKPQNSGFSGYWSDPENSRKFNNNYFQSILNKGWMTEKVAATGKMQWKRTDIGLPRGTHEMMLDTDMCLAYAGTRTDDSNPSADIKAAEHNCCAWRFADGPGGKWGNDNISASNPYCGVNTADIKSLNLNKFGVPPADQTKGAFKIARALCCQDLDAKDGRPSASSGINSPDCGNAYPGNGRAYAAVDEFAANEGAWLATFMQAWHKATEKGHFGLFPML